jgi:hypothetical protein
MRRRVHPFQRALNLMVGFGLLFGGVVGAAYLVAIEDETIWQITMVATAIILGAAWIYDDLLDPMDDVYLDYEQDDGPDRQRRTSNSDWTRSSS